MDKKLFFGAILKFVLGVVLVGALIFLPAGSFSYLNGWILMGVLFVPIFIVGVIMMIKSPSLLASRLSSKEKQKEQGLVQKLSGIMFIAGFVLSGLGYRFGWYSLPIWVVIVGAVLFILAYIMYAEVLRENAYLSRTIEVQQGQKVIDNGLYGVVRHPMYSSTIILFLAIPLILGSVFALLVFLAYPFIIGFRIKHEEEFLERELEGYKEYKNKVKYRIIPFIF